MNIYELIEMKWYTEKLYAYRIDLDGIAKKKIERERTSRGKEMVKESEQAKNKLNIKFFYCC